MQFSHRWLKVGSAFQFDFILLQHIWCALCSANQSQESEALNAAHPSKSVLKEGSGRLLQA